MRCSLDDLRTFGINADQCGRLLPRTKGMAQDGGARSRTFHDEIDCRREKQGWTTACSSMPDRDGKDQREDSSKHASLC